jgi:DNA-binding GntR family transcriptional regulator
LLRLAHDGNRQRHAEEHDVKNQTDVQLNLLIDSIKQDIIFGRLRPRERLLEDQLSERFNMSRHQVRMAFSVLDQMGLVTRRPNKGAIVRDFSVEEAEEVYELRALLQGEAARRIPMPAPADLLNRLDQIQEAFCAAADAGDLQRVCKLNNEFHGVIFGACNNRYLAETIDRFWIQTLGIRCYAIGDPALLVHSRNEHAAMIRYLREGDRESFVQLCIDHIWRPFEAYKRAHGGWTTLQQSA